MMLQEEKRQRLSLLVAIPKEDVDVMMYWSLALHAFSFPSCSALRLTRQTIKNIKMMIHER